MLVSNFSLGYVYPFTPTSYRWTAGYTLQITNLEANDIQFGIECRVTYHYFGGTDSSKQSDTALLKELLGREWHKVQGGYYAMDLWTIPGKESRRWHLQPYMYQSRQWTPYVDGYVSLRVPMVRSNKAPYGLVAQSHNPVGVLLSAWREDQRHQENPGPADVETSSQSALQLASGKAYNEIIPDTSLYVNPKYMSTYTTELAKSVETQKAAAGALRLLEADAAQALIDLLTHLSDDEEEVEELNKALRKLGAAVSVRLTPGKKR